MPRSLSRRSRIALALLTGLFLGWIALYWSAAPASPLVTSRVVPAAPGSEGPLVVLVHGMGGVESIEPLVQAIHADADLAHSRLLVLSYRSWFWVNSSAERLARSVYAAIDAAATPNQPIILVGHSLGGVLLRYAYLYNGKQNLWADNVQSMVLLAALNRGWTSEIAQGIKRPMLMVGRWLLPKLGLGGLYDDLQFGGSFVAGLRLNWIRAMRERASASGPQLVVTQIRGMDDDIVSPRDTADLEGSSLFRRIELANTDHASVLQLDGAEGDVRRTVILSEIAGRGHVKAPEMGADSCSTRHDDSVTDVLFAVHGMRTQGSWTSDLVAEAQAALPATTRTIAVSYSWFPMVPFLFEHQRAERLSAFIDAYTEAIACYPALKRVSAIAHSNGSYIVVNSLRKVPAMMLHRLVTAGSILPENLDWGMLRGRVDHVANYTGNADVVVGIFPALFEVISRETADMGAGGLWGFHKRYSLVKNFKSFAGGHSDVIGNPVARKKMIEFVASPDASQIQPAPDLDIVWWAAASSRCCWLVWLFLLAVLIAIPIGLQRLYVRWKNQLVLRRAVATLTVSYVIAIIGVGFFY